METSELITIMVAAAQGLYAAIGILLICVKPFRKWFLCAKERKQEDELKEQSQNEALKCLLRSDILKIYYANHLNRVIHSYEYQNIEMLYKAYKSLGGNSFIDKIWNEVQEWDIAP